MSDELKGAIITAIVTGIISIIGFVVIYNSMKKNFKNELEKEKTVGGDVIAFVLVRLGIFA